MGTELGKSKILMMIMMMMIMMMMMMTTMMMMMMMMMMIMTTIGLHSELQLKLSSTKGGLVSSPALCAV